MLKTSMKVWLHLYDLKMIPLKEQISTDTIFNKKGYYTIAAIDISAHWLIDALFSFSNQHGYQ